MKTPIPPVLLPRSPPCPVSAQEEFQVNSLDPTVRNLRQLQAGSRQAVNALLAKHWEMGIISAPAATSPPSSRDG